MNADVSLMSRCALILYREYALEQQKRSDILPTCSTYSFVTGKKTKNKIKKAKNKKLCV